MVFNLAVGGVFSRGSHQEVVGGGGGGGGILPWGAFAVCLGCVMTPDRVARVPYRIQISKFGQPGNDTCAGPLRAEGNFPRIP